MKIAFVGKGGSGKTTLAALFILHEAQKNTSVLAVDADINMHLGELIGIATVPADRHVSYPAAVKDILRTLMGSNGRIRELSHFKKTTPPGTGSHLVTLSGNNDPILNRYTEKRGSIRFMVVGTYDEDGIGTSCYHNNLAILENVLSHTNDDGSIIAVDMVAGTDAFAGSLHAQFDLLAIVVEPTKRSLEVYMQFKKLAAEAGVAGSLVVVGNKVASLEDEQFLRMHVPTDSLVGMLYQSEYLRSRERDGGALDIEELEKENYVVLEDLRKRLGGAVIDPDERLRTLHRLHIRYVRQSFITERFGDLTGQVDPDFSYSRIET